MSMLYKIITEKYVLKLRCVYPFISVGHKCSGVFVVPLKNYYIYSILYELLLDGDICMVIIIAYSMYTIGT